MNLFSWFSWNIKGIIFVFDLLFVRLTKIRYLNFHNFFIEDIPVDWKNDLFYELTAIVIKQTDFFHSPVMLKKI